MAGVASNEEAEQAAAGDRPAAPTAEDARAAAAILDPQLLMAARRGEKNRLKELLRLSDEEEQAAGMVEPAEAAVVVQVDRSAPAAPSPSSSRGAASLLLLAGVTIDGDSLLHVVAASGDGDDFLRCARMICYNGSTSLLDARNSKGDTPLHCAAAAGNAGMVSCLVALASRGGETEAVKEELLRKRKNGGETALHKAVRAASKVCIDKLMSVDPELACVPRHGDDGITISPLYLAVSLGKMDIAEHLIHKSNRKLSCSGPDGRNVLHAAVSRGQALPKVLKWFEDVMVEVKEGDRRITVPLLSQLTIQRDKQTGSTPLHLAAGLEGWPDVKILSKCFPNVWPRPESALKLLLEPNPCAVYQPDTQGLYPIHVAALSGSLNLVKIMLQSCPDCATLRDGKGRTFLHVAVEEERYRLVQYACHALPQGFSFMVLNAQDNDGDTALHRAVHVGNLHVFNCLIRNQHVNLNIPNKDELTPLDLSWCRIPSLFYYGSNPMCLIQLSLQLVGAPCGGRGPDLLSEKHIPKRDISKVSKHLTTAAQVMGIVSVLVATVTFASAFTLPGGYYQSGSNNAGAALLAGSYAFDAFILSDTLAFICSCIATFSLIFAGVPAMDISIRLRYFEISALVLRSSGRNLVVAFALGLYMVLAPVAHTTAVAVCVIISISSLYGNSEAWQILGVANTARARLGTRLPVPWTCVVMFYNVFGNVLLHFWSCLIIFGLPAIWN
ncbi:hypothetical protein ACP70R_042060 [Stipagrostis hirtigluma subsp. patula]